MNNNMTTLYNVSWLFLVLALISGIHNLLKTKEYKDFTLCVGFGGVSLILFASMGMWEPLKAMDEMMETHIRTNLGTSETAKTDPNVALLCLSPIFLCIISIAYQLIQRAITQSNQNSNSKKPS